MDFLTGQQAMLQPMTQKILMLTLLIKKNTSLSLLSYGRQLFCIAPCQVSLNWNILTSFRYHSKKDVKKLEQIERTAEIQGFENVSQKERIKSKLNFIRED